MADLARVAANVRIISGTVVSAQSGQIGLEPGHTVYKNSSNKFLECDSNSAVSDDIAGIFIGFADLDEWGAILQNGGIFYPGVNAVDGELYVISDTAGEIQPFSDLGSGEFITIVGVGNSDNNIVCGFHTTGFAKP